jgi:Bacteriophage tail sheath protein
MAEQFLHGVEIVEINTGIRPVRTVKSSVIGLVGTAPLADDSAFPLDTPVLIAGSPLEAADLGADGTLLDAVNAVLDQIGAMVVVVRVAEGADDAETQTNVIGGVDGATGDYTGLQALIAAQSVIHVEPRIVIAPGFSHVQAVATDMIIVADRLKGVAILDGGNTTDADALAYAILFAATRRAYVVDPWTKIWDTTNSVAVLEPASARVAGMIARSDNERGFWWSPSNQAMAGIVGTGRPVDFKLGDPNSRANLLNEGKVATIINQDGYRLWGNRTTSTDAKWAFLNVVRTADIINDSLQRAHLWAVDRNISKNYFVDVAGSVNNYLRHLKKIGAILGGECWADPELNTPAELQAGRTYFDFDFTPPAPAEHITFRSHLVNDYFTVVFD